MGIMDGFTTAQESGKSTVKKVGIGGYSMFARVNDSTSYPSQVPVDVLEDGSNASDDIINGPITIKISGVVADVYMDAKPNSSFGLIPDYSKYGEVVEYIPAKTQQQLQKMNEIADRAEQKILEAKRLADKGAELFGLVGNPVAVVLKVFVNSSLISLRLCITASSLYLSKWTTGLMKTWL